MGESATGLIVLIVACLILFWIIRGIAVIMTTHFLLGLLLMIFLTPLFLLWAFIEGIK
jgi:hypothetical protein